MSFKYAPFTRWLIARICQVKGLPTDPLMFSVGEQIMELFEKAAAEDDFSVAIEDDLWSDLPNLHPEFQTLGVEKMLDTIKLHCVLAYFTSEEDYQELLSGDSSTLSNKYFVERLTELQRNAVKMAHAVIEHSREIFKEYMDKHVKKDSELKWFAFDKVLIPE